MDKVLIVFHDSDSFSGGNASMLDVLKNIHASADFELAGLVPLNKNKNEGVVSELTKMKIDYLQANYYPARYQRSSFFPKNVYRMLKCILRNAISAFTCFRVWSALKNSNVSLVYSNTSDIYIGALLAKMLHAKHIWHFREFGHEDQNAYHLCGDKFFYKLANQLSDAIVLISDALKSKVLHYLGPGKLNLIYDDLYPEPQQLPNFIKREGAKAKFLIVGSIIPGKGQFDIINALTMLQQKGIDFTLGIAGHDESDYANFLKQYVNKLRLSDNVKFLGFSSDLSKIRQEYDIGIIASHSEAFGRVTIEGMMSGLIMIGRNSGSNKELIISGENGFIYNDNIELIDIVEKIIDGKVNVNLIRDNAYHFSQQFTQARGSKRIAELIKQVISKE